MCALIGWELLLAIWIATGIGSRAAILAAIATFSVFFVYTAFGLSQGQATCGCFGSAETPLRWVAVMDGFMVALLASVAWFSDGGAKRPCIWTSLAFPVAFCAAIVTLGSGVTLASDGVAIDRGMHRAYLMPEFWEGKRFGLLDHVREDLPIQLDGEWVVIVFKKSCPNCVRFFSDLESARQSALDYAGVDGSRQVLLIEAPIDGLTVTTAGRSRGVRRTSLVPSYEWRVRTPVVLQVKDGIVSHVHHRG